MNAMTSSSRQVPELDGYLARHGFVPYAANNTWLDRDTGQGSSGSSASPASKPS